MTETSYSPVELSLSSQQNIDDRNFQILSVRITNSDRIISPGDLSKIVMPKEINTAGGIIISGRGPIWLYAYLLHELHHTRWVACYDPRLPGGVVVASHCKEAQVGQVIKITLETN